MDSTDRLEVMEDGMVPDLRDPSVTPDPVPPTELGDFFLKAPVLTCRATPDGYLAEVGGPWTETLGWTREQLTSRPFFDLVHPDDIAATTDALSTLNQGSAVAAFVNRYRDVDGAWHHIRWHCHQTPDGLIYAVAIDVTHEVAQELALKFHTLMLEALTEFQDATIDSDLTDVPARVLGERLRQLTGANEVMVAATTERRGYGPVLAVLSATPAFAAAVEHHSPATADIWSPMPCIGFMSDLNTLTGAAVRTGEPVLAGEAEHDERRSTHPEHEPQLVNLVALPLSGVDGIAGVIALGNLPVGADPELVNLLEPVCATVANAIERVTARERQRELNRENDKAKALLRAIAEDTDTLLVVTHADESVYFLNAGAERLLGVSSQVVAGTATVAAFVGVPGTDPAGSRTDYMEAYRLWATDPNRSRAEWTFIGTDGTRTPMLVTVTALYDSDGAPDGWVHMGTSLADRHEADQNRSQAAELSAEITSLRDRERELGLLAEATEYVMSATSLRDALQVIRTYVPNILGTDTLDVLPVTLGSPRDPNEDDLHVAIRTEDCWALRTGHAHLTRSGQAARCRHLGSGSSSHLCVPLTDGDRTVAVLSTRVDLLGSSEREATSRAEDVARQMGVALANLSLRRSLERQAVADPLTGVGNRRAADRDMQHALGSCRRNNETFGILMIDLDRFKTVNDTHGHEVGDRVLCEVAELMRNSLREGDTVARLGGEEFLVVLRNIGPQATVDVAEALRRRIEDEVQVADGWNCTVSVGALHVSDAISDSDSLIAAADCALYRAKEHGRNMVVVAMEQDAIDNPCSGPTRVRLIQDALPAPTAAPVVDPADESTPHQGAGRP
jgi:diguanylate cyclase (GGDEF)-like protein/PAS domain S-box-containing protein